MSKPILYSYFRSSCSWRVRIALALKNMNYEYRAVNLLTGEHRDSFAKINPMCQVPALVVDNGETAITQSLAIIDYLDTAYPDSYQLLPKDLKERIRVKELADMICSGIQPLQNLGFLKKLIALNVDEQKFAADFITEKFAALENLLHRYSGTYCVGDTITLADVCLLPQVYNARRFKVDIDKFKHISEISDRLSTIEAFDSTKPESMPDCPPQLKSP